ncbi:T7 tail fiber protein [Enterobacter hormaechei]|uniref:tail fiber/spike domain-containing protein n=1 Tax=Enterobacter hormaechei TaxID=158836 RepID=UPI000794E511|nr:hypothetical protein [Enterobacter hormaechei]CAE6313457.1 hypothetical protein AI2716V1_0024 [Enterobacter cloacae]CAH3317857.1 hypothetical protein AI2716V1_0024 [Enterobacter cloacae]SAG93760.1 T7 tail fiber protein [Enterobacter hormaechei]
MAEQKVKLTDLPAATDTVDTAQLLINQNDTDQKLPVTHFLRAKNNLSDLTDIVQARANLDVPSVDEVNDKLTGFIDGSNTFSSGASIAARTDYIWDEESKSWYYWSGSLPKDVPAASTPKSTGGIGPGAWSAVGDTVLRSMLSSQYLIRTPESFGAKGDGLTDDTAAMQLAFAWVTAANGRQLISGPGALYRLTSTVIADFKGRKNCSILFSTPIFADTDTGICLKILDTLMSEFKFSFQGGGVWSGGTPTYGTSTMPTGAQIGVFIQACRQCGFDIQAENYKGRVIHVTERNSDGVTGQTWKTSGMMFRRISTGTAVATQCGQSLWADGRSGDLSNFGEIVTWYSLWDMFGPVFNKALDLTIHHMESGWQTNNGLIFKGCKTLHLLAINLGDESAGTVEQMRFQPSDDGWTCDTVHIESMHVGSSYRGLHVAAGAFLQGDSSSWINIDTSNSRDCGVILDGWGAGKVRHYSRDDNESLRVTNNTFGFDCEIVSVSARNKPVTISSSVIRIRMRGAIINPSSTASGPLVDIPLPTSGYLFEGMHFRLSAVNNCIFSAGNSNYRVIGCSFDRNDNPSAPVFLGGVIPKVTNNGGFISDNHGSAVIPAGSTSITVNHGLALAPSSVNLTAGANATSQVRATTLGATTFTITIATAPGSDATVYWEAKI